jgi:hypothetical protein
MDILLESLYQCQGGLLRRERRLREIEVSGKATAEEFRELLGNKSYIATDCYSHRDIVPVTFRVLLYSILTVQTVQCATELY